MKRLAEFYRGKPVLITGHTGFKGSWLALWLAEMGANVHGYALAPETPSLFAEADLAGRLASHTIGDVRNYDQLSKAVREAKPAVIFHLAAQTLVRRSYREVRETYDTNVMGTVNVLEAARAAGTIRVCQIISSDKCYENREWPYAYRENDPMGGFDPYSSSKGCAELVVAAYRRSFFNPAEIARHGVSLSSARAGNVIGGGDWAEDRIVPDCIRALGAHQPITVRNPHAIRPWQHVLEPLSGYLRLAWMQWQQPADFADAWNFGPFSSECLPVAELVQQTIAAWGAGSWVDQSDASAASASTPLHEAKFLKLDITKSLTLLGWKPTYNVREAVAETVRWYRARAEQGAAFDAAKFCHAQIQSYAALATLGEPTV